MDRRCRGSGHDRTHNSSSACRHPRVRLRKKLASCDSQGGSLTRALAIYRKATLQKLRRRDGRASVAEEGIYWYSYKKIGDAGIGHRAAELRRQERNRMRLRAGGERAVGLELERQKALLRHRRKKSLADRRAAEDEDPLAGRGGRRQVGIEEGAVGGGEGGAGGRTKRRLTGHGRLAARGQRRQCALPDVGHVDGESAARQRRRGLRIGDRGAAERDARLPALVGEAEPGGAVAVRALDEPGYGDDHGRRRSRRGWRLGRCDMPGLRLLDGGLLELRLA